MSVAPLLTTVSIWMCGSGGPRVGVTDIVAPPGTVADFSKGIAALGFSGGIGVVDLACSVAVAGFSKGMGAADVTGDEVCAAGCSAC